MKKIFLLVFIICLLQNVKAQIKWPIITQQTKPWTRWWWEGSAVDKPNLTASDAIIPTSRIRRLGNNANLWGERRRKKIH